MIKPSTQSKQHMPIIKKAKGKWVTDVDNNRYIDFTGSNLTNVLGYVKAKKCIPNLPGVSVREAKLTSLLRTYTRTNYWRFFKSGHESVECAIRLSKHIIGKPNAKCIFVGYAGALDLYVWTFNKNGIAEQNSIQVLPYSKYNGKIDILVFESRYSDYADTLGDKDTIRICDHLKSGIRGLYELENE